MRNILYFFQYLPLRILSVINNALTYGQTSWLADRVGKLAFRLARKKREIALANLRASFPNRMNESEIHEIAITSFQNIFHTGSEVARIPQVHKNPALFLEPKGFEKLGEELKKGRGVIALIAHYGNWEIMAQASLMEGFPVHAVARNLKNPFADRYLKRLRNLMGVTVIEKDGAVQGCIRALKENKVVAILLDQHERRGGVWVDFFGRAACTSGLAATLALKYDVPVLPFFHFRQHNAPDIVECQDPMPLIRSGSHADDVFANTQLYVRAIEEVIRERPEEWLWMHRRWRERPSNQVPVPKVGGTV